MKTYGRSEKQFQRGLRGSSSPNNHAMAGCQRNGAGSGGRGGSVSNVRRQRNGTRMFRSGSGEGADFAGVSVRIANIGANLGTGSRRLLGCGQKNTHSVTIASANVPMTAIALPLMPGKWTSRSVCAGTGAASASVIFWRMILF